MADSNQTVVTSGFGRINWRDLGQGALMAALGAVAAIVYPILESGSLEFDFSRIWKMAVGAALLHLIRKLMTGPTVVITNPTPQQVQAVKEGEAQVQIRKAP